MNEKILFITSTRIGDAVLSTGVLGHLLTTYPTGQVTIACGPLVASLFEGVPRLERLILLKKESWNRHWIKLWLATRQTKWDVIVDLRNSAVSYLIPSGKCYRYGGYINKNQHKVLQNAAVMSCSTPPAPRLFVSVAQAARAVELIPDGVPVLAIGPTANWVGKIWPPENFIQLLANVLAAGGRFHGWRVAVFAAPGEESVAQCVFDTLPESSRINLIAKGNPGVAAACLARCQYYIGNDSGLMHCAAAAGVPTLGLFGPTDDRMYAPYGPHAAHLHTPQTMQELVGAPDFNAKAVTGSLMGGLTVQSVLAHLNKATQ
jgi:heptosyltransferase-3